MSIKIESSVEEVKKWITEEDVHDLLFAFGIIEDEYTYNKNQDVFLPLEKKKSSYEEQLKLEEVNLKVLFGSSRPNGENQNNGFSSVNITSSEKLDNFGAAA
ncbi:hypothetical protein PJ964_002896 [Enterococcus faecalis]|uniref:hypothetical protein n=1 Tax=Enterococcus TaxID=1350 RepID=UPI0003545708|nr:hypothetical protein [Enterococcus faecalis]OWW57451.1 hypothetical protein F521_13630 [Enterococcus hirae 67-03-C5]AWQ39313.1 hypothetical protein CNQ40_05570 [Enterococcus faecalis]EGO2529296.1 hypothetical protein [Enterococcus faecalis]EGO2635101.1 hypothetical protein [Enterococcus faecalis]EGO2656887.1 hypothetical protein [Enterococcus faecalis]